MQKSLLSSYNIIACGLCGHGVRWNTKVHLVFSNVPLMFHSCLCVFVAVFSQRQTQDTLSSWMRFSKMKPASLGESGKLHLSNILMWWDYQVHIQMVHGGAVRNRYSLCLHICLTDTHDYWCKTVKTVWKPTQSHFQFVRYGRMVQAPSASHFGFPQLVFWNTRCYH